MVLSELPPELSISRTAARTGETSSRPVAFKTGGFVVLHDKGNEENVFDRVDYQISSADSIHLNFGYTRSWFQTPNTFDSQNATPWNGVVVANGGLDPNGNVVGPGLAPPPWLVQTQGGTPST